MLIEPARQLGIEWDAIALDAAVTAGGGYPQSLQIIGAATWDAAQPAEGDTLTLADLEGGRAASEADIASLFLARWDVATDAEKALLLAMARHPDSEIERGTVAAEMGVNTKALGMARRSLISKGIIEAPRRGVLRFTIPGFASYVRAQDDHLLERPAADSSRPTLGAPEGRAYERRPTGPNDQPRRRPAL